MFANFLALPFLLGTLTFLYLAWAVDDSYAFWLVPFLVIAVVVYIMAPQINWWWYRRRPPRLSKGLADTLRQFCPYFQRLSPEDRVRFEGRVALFRMGTDWTPLGWPEDTLPPDVELAVSAQAVSLLFGKKELLFPKFETVILYPRQFPTPEHPYPHSSELYEPDGCLIFSAENLMLAFLNPGKWYNVALHEYAKAFVLQYPSDHWPALNGEEDWERLERAGGMSRAHIESMTGLAGLEPLPVAIHHFILLPEGLKKEMPEVYEALEQLIYHG